MVVAVKKEGYPPMPLVSLVLFLPLLGALLLVVLASGAAACGAYRRPDHRRG